MYFVTFHGTDSWHMEDDIQLVDVDVHLNVTNNVVNNLLILNIKVRRLFLPCLRTQNELSVAL